MRKSKLLKFPIREHKSGFVNCSGGFFRVKTTLFAFILFPVGMSKWHILFQNVVFRVFFLKHNCFIDFKYSYIEYVKSKLSIIIFYDVGS